MKNFGLILVLLLSISCSDNSDEFEQILPNIPVDKTIFLNNPEYIDLQVVGGWAYTGGGISGIVIYHYGVNSYVAFDRAAPHLKPQPCSQMKVKNSIKMVCACDNSEFSILDGSPLTDGIKYAAKQYRVVLLGNNTLRITNY